MLKTLLECGVEKHLKIEKQLIVEISEIDIA